VPTVAAILCDFVVVDFADVCISLAARAWPYRRTGQSIFSAGSPTGASNASRVAGPSLDIRTRPNCFLAETKHGPARLLVHKMFIKKSRLDGRMLRATGYLELQTVLSNLSLSISLTLGAFNHSPTFYLPD
jgi:hypothetical protein